MKTDKKIAVFGVKTVPYSGGIENVVENTMPHISGFNTVIYVRKKYFNNEKLKNVKLFCLPHIYGKSIEAITHTLIAIIHALFIERANIFFFHAVVLGIFTPIPKLFGKKVILQTHGLDWKREKWGKISKILIKLSTYFAVKIPDRTICVSATDQEYIFRKFKKKLNILPNGVQIPEYSEEKDYLNKNNIYPKSYILFMARLVPEKGAHLLIEAYSKILSRDENFNLKLVIAGDTNYHDDYYDSLKKYESENIIFTGFVNGDIKYTLLKNATFFIQPSTIEGMSTGILEAMAMGILPIVSDIKENLDVINGFGYSFNSGSSDNLAEVIINALNYPKLDQKIEMIEFVKKHFTWQKTISELIKIFEGL